MRARGAGRGRLIRAKWSQRIHDEWLVSLLRDRPELTIVQLERSLARVAAEIPVGADAMPTT